MHKPAVNLTKVAWCTNYNNIENRHKAVSLSFLIIHSVTFQSCHVVELPVYIGAFTQ